MCIDLSLVLLHRLYSVSTWSYTSDDMLWSTFWQGGLGTRDESRVQLRGWLVYRCSQQCKLVTNFMKSRVCDIDYRYSVTRDAPVYAILSVVM